MRDYLPSLSKKFFAQTLLLTAGFGLFVTGASAQSSAGEGVVTVQMMDSEGESVGTVEVEQLAHGTLFMADLKNLPAGGHAFHVHETAKCEPDFKAAGGHYNPLDNKHGLDNSDGHHAGDLPNVYVTDDGAAKAAFFSHQLALDTAAGAKDDAAGKGPFALRDQDGSAVMIHENADSYEATPPDAVGAGARIACGVIPAGG